MSSSILERLDKVERHYSNSNKVVPSQEAFLIS
jgi:hypothetical protein